ncbi:chloride channel [Mrakia frigida]|uniref:chloride channel protein n=1 Tax=Mrakia frigida TaxID=29902 RepID=UPI003FCC0611
MANPPLTPRSILRQRPPTLDPNSSVASSLTSTENNTLPSNLASSEDDEGDDERDSLLFAPASPFSNQNQSNLHQSFTASSSTSASTSPSARAPRPLHPPRRPTSLSFNAPSTTTTNARPSGPRRTHTTDSLLFQEGADGGGYGTFGSPGGTSSSTRRRTWLGGGGGGGSERGSRRERIKRRLEVTASVVGVRRAVSYDDGFDVSEAEDEGGRANGNRTWYSSFVSIDWIHDQIKDSSRVRRLHSAARRSHRGKIALLLDRSQGWLIVTIVGVLTAMVAFCIVRGEGWLFDLKDGYCTKEGGGGWQLSRGFCCRGVEGVVGEVDEQVWGRTSWVASSSLNPLVSEEESCPDWRTWDSVLGPYVDGPNQAWIPLERYMVEYLAYIIVSLALATTSSFLTIKLSKSTDHETKKNVVVAVQEGLPSEDNLEKEAVAPRKVMYFAAGSGIPEVKTVLSGFVIHGYLGGWTLFTKAVGLTLSVASGLNLGKEGPMVHIASCIGNMVSRVFVKYETNEMKRREVLSAACAAGVAVAFGAPLGGVLFSLEEVSTFFPPKVLWRSFWAAMVATATLKAMNPFGTGKIVLFQVSYDNDWRFWELPVFVLIGVLMGIYGALFAKLNIRWAKHVRNGTWLKTHPITEVALVTLLTGLLSFLNPYTRMSGTELVLSLLSECTPESASHLCVSRPEEIGGVVSSILLAMLVKGGLTVITFGIKLPAGVFIPTLAVGACCGRVLGLGIQYLESQYPSASIFETCTKHGDCVVPGVFAVVGAAASLAGVTRTTVSLAVIVLELTGSLTYVVPVSIAILVAKTVADSLEPRGIYDLVIQLAGLPFLDSKETHRWGALQVVDAADSAADVIRCDRDNTVSSLTTKLVRICRAGGHDGGFPVVEKEAGGLRLRGIIAVNELEHALFDLSSSPLSVCNLKPSLHLGSRRSGTMSVTSFQDASGFTLPGHGKDPFDLVSFIDQASPSLTSSFFLSLETEPLLFQQTPLTVQLHSPLELVQQLFVKLGVRQVVVVNEKGFYQGLISKSQWLSFLAKLEEENGH